MSPRDFLEDSQPNPSGQSMAMNAGSPRDFLAENENPKESFGTSAAMAIPRVLTDLGKSAWSGIKAIPGMYESAKTEVPGLYSMVRDHPGHAALQGLAGSQEAINKLAQMPSNLAQYGANRLNLLPQGAANAISNFGPQDTTGAINQLFDKPKYPGEALLRGAISDIPNIYAGGKALTALNPTKLLTTKNGIKNAILKPHDALENRANTAFKEVSSGVNARGVNQLPTASLSPIDFNNMRSYFPATRQYDTLLTGAEYGDYNALRKLQSDLYTNGKKNLGSGLEADRMKGAEMLEKRNDINQVISDHLIKTGNTDLADKLQVARNDWRTLQQTYYNENMNNALVNMVNKQFRKVPNNLIDILGEDSIPMKNLLDFHPGLESRIKGYKRGQNILGKSLKYGIPAGAAFAGYEYGKPGSR